MNIMDAGSRVLRILDQEETGSEILDRQMMRRIDRDIDDAISGRQRWYLPPLPQGYSWVESGDDVQSRNTPSIRTPEGRYISPENLEKHVFVTDRSPMGRYARIWQRGIEGLRDSTIRHEWGLSPENQTELDTFFGNGFLRHPPSAVANLGAYGLDLLNVPSQTAVAALSQYLTEFQDNFGLPTWKYGSSRPDDMWEAGSSAYEDWVEALPVMAAPLGSAIGKATPKSFLNKYDQDYVEALIATKSIKSAKVLADPYDGDSHHSLIRRPVVRWAKKKGWKWLENIGESKWNKWDTSRWSRLDFVKEHDRVHSKTITSRMPDGLPSANPRHFGVVKYGPVGRFWYGMPLRTRVALSTPAAIGGGILLWNEVIDEPKIPPDRD